MATFALIHGAGDVGWYWHLVEAALRERGHDTLAPDLPIDDDTATLSDYADAVLDAIGTPPPDDLVVVGMSFGGYAAPIVASRVPTRHLVYVCAMIPQPGETAYQMWESTGYHQEPQVDDSVRAVFYHDVPPALAEEALAHGRDQSDRTLQEPWPLAALPNVPVTCIVGTRDRLFPVDWLSNMSAARLGVTPIEIDTGHCAALARPRELADLLEGVITST
jgi:pimeloyl-ACP methyl ester carboxylesterase